MDAVYFLADTPNAIDTAYTLTKRWWPDHAVALIPLKPEQFARASFTPLAHLDELGVSPRSLGKDCVEPH